MRVLSIVICLTVYLGIVICEQCTTEADCAATSCNIGNSVACQLPPGVTAGTANGLCTCEHNTCALANDCHGTNANLNCPDEIRHCYDGSCICNKWDVVGK